MDRFETHSGTVARMYLIVGLFVAIIILLVVLFKLQKPDPDLDVARKGYLQGRNHPVDIEYAISFSTVKDCQNRLQHGHIL